MRILVFIPSLGYGGAEITIINLSNYFDSLGHNVTILTMLKTTKRVDGLNKNIKVIEMDNETLNLGVTRKVVNFILRIYKLQMKVRSINPDVSLSFLTEANTIFLCSNLFSQRKIIINERTNPKLHKPSLFYRFLRYLLYRLATILVVQTDEIKKLCQKFVKDSNVRVIPNFVRDEFFETTRIHSENKSVDYCVGFIGRLSKEKRVSDLISSFVLVIKTFPNARLVVTGDGLEKENLRNLVMKLKLTNHVIIEDARSNVKEAFSKISIFVLPSAYEGFSNVLLEAMASRVAILTTCEGGSYLIDHQDCGLLFDAGDVNQLARGICYLLQNPEIMKNFAENANIKVQSFSKAAILPIWGTLVEEIANGS
jgi:glycosyltransferase involved in cell wall biosynthesis